MSHPPQPDIRRNLWHHAVSLIGCPTEAVTATLERLIRDLGEHMQARCAYVLDLDPRTGGAEHTASWSADPELPAAREVRESLTGMLPWAGEALKSGAPVQVTDIQRLPENLNEEKALLRNRQTRALIWVPLIHETELSGLLGLEFAKVSRSWNPDDLDLLRQAADVVGRAMLRRTMETELIHGQQLYRSLVEADLFSLFILELPSAKVMYVNPQGCRLIGYTFEEVTELTAWDLVDPADHNNMAERLRAQMESESDMTTTQTYTLHTKDGRKLKCDSSATVVEYHGRRALQGVIYDVTERERLMRQLQQAQKMEAIGTLAGGIAHDFNNILGSILGYSEIAKMHYTENSKAHAFTDRVIQAALRAKDLVAQILAFSRKSEPEKQTVNIGILVKEILKLLRATLPSTIEIVQDIRLSMDTIWADATQIHQVLMNLCTNAAHAMEADGGRLEIRLRNRTVTPEDLARFADIEPGVYVQLTVKDTGKGIDPSIRQRIFDPYFTTKEKGKGTGLGLAVVHGIVTRHGGAIDFISEVGQGSTFELLFPARNSPKLFPTGKEVGQLPGGSERILVVDDEKYLADMCRYVLNQLGYSVTALNSPVEALELFERGPDRFDLLVTDMTMPGMTGRDLAVSVLNIRPDLPIILCTGYSEWINEERAMALGIRGYLSKPFSIQALAVRIRNLLDGR